MEKPNRTHLLEIAIDAKNGDAHAIQDFEWFICWRLRLWERAEAIKLVSRGFVVAYARFDWRRWQDMCLQVRARLFDYLSRITDPGGRAPEFFANFDSITHQVCQESFKQLRAEIRARGLPLIDPVSGDVARLHEQVLASLATNDEAQAQSRLGKYLL